MLKKIKNKKGISEIVSYTLLIVIAISLAVLVYSFLKIYIPKEKLSCPDDISLIIKDANCILISSSPNLTITLENKGLFNITDVYIRVGGENKQVKTQINKGHTSFLPPLSPGQEINEDISNSFLANVITRPGNYTLEIEPAVNTEKGLALCNNAVVDERIVCK